jgi:hypothetical protein
MNFHSASEQSRPRSDDIEERGVHFTYSAAISMKSDTGMQSSGALDKNEKAPELSFRGL